MAKSPGSGRLLRGVVCLGLLTAVAACGSDNGGSGGTTAGTSPAVSAGETTASAGGATTAAPASSEAPAAAYNVTVALPLDVDTLDPQTTQSQPGRIVYGNIFEPLVRRSVDGKSIEPLLATDLPTSVDPTTWEIKLRDDVTFASGKQFTSADVIYTFKRIFDPATDSQQADLLKTITSTTAVDEHTVRFTTDGPDPLLPARLAYALIVPEGQAEVAGFPEQGLDGTGPYALDHHTAGVEVAVTKRTGYWGGDLPQAPDTFTYKAIQDPAAMLAALQTNEIDINTSLTPEQADQVPQAKSIIATESALVRTNTLKGPLQDVNLRKAINMAIDRESIVKALYAGKAIATPCQIPTTQVFGHTGSLEVPKYDPDAAKQLVQQYYKGETLTMYGIARFAGLQEAAQAIAQNLQDVGFKIDLQFPQSQDALIAQFSGDKSKYVDLMLYQSSAEVLFDEAQQLQWLTSDGLYSTINDPQIDALAKTATSTLDETARQGAYDQLNQLACDNVYNAYVYYPPVIYGLSDKINWEPRADGLILAQDITPKS
jgi:peptide/nickel transport system substrate-binding protein